MCTLCSCVTTFLCSSTLFCSLITIEVNLLDGFGAVDSRRDPFISELFCDLIVVLFLIVTFGHSWTLEFSVFFDLDCHTSDLIFWLL